MFDSEIGWIVLGLFFAAIVVLGICCELILREFRKLDSRMNRVEGAMASNRTMLEANQIALEWVAKKYEEASPKGPAGLPLGCQHED